VGFEEGQSGGGEEGVGNGSGERSGIGCRGLAALEIRLGDAFIWVRGLLRGTKDDAIGKGHYHHSIC